MYSLSSSCCCSSYASFSTLSFNLSCPYPIFSIILLYNKEVVSPTLCSLSASASRVAATGADTALYHFVNWFLIQLVMFITGFRGKFENICRSFLRHWPDNQKTIIWCHIQLTFINNVFTIYLCMHGMSWVPHEAAYFIDIFTAHEMSHTAIEDKP